MPPVTVEQFKKTFLKPKRSETTGNQTVHGSEKNSLEQAANRGNSDDFARQAKEMFRKNSKYFVELLGYKLSKHWATDELSMWLNSSPTEAVKEVLKTFKEKNFPAETDRIAFNEIRQFSSLFEKAKGEKLLLCGEAMWDHGKWEDVRDALDVKNLETLNEKVATLNQIYEDIRENQTNNEEQLCINWSGVLMQQMYQKRDELREKERTGSRNFERELKQVLPESSRTNKQEFELIMERLGRFGNVVFKLNKPEGNDCGDFSQRVLDLCKPNPMVVSDQLTNKINDNEDKEAFIKRMKASFKNVYQSSNGVVRVKILYNQAKAMCEHHFRTVVGCMGGKYVTFEANVGKKFLLAPELMVVGLEELLCWTDATGKPAGDSEHIEGFTFASLPKGNLEIEWDTEDDMQIRKFIDEVHSYGDFERLVVQQPVFMEQLEIEPEVANQVWDAWRKANNDLVQDEPDRSVEYWLDILRSLTNEVSQKEVIIRHLQKSILTNLEQY